MDTQKPTSKTCHCGCGGSPKRGRYLPGHDARHKSDLIKKALEGSKRAINKLESLGWLGFLEKAKARQELQTAGHKESSGK